MNQLAKIDNLPQMCEQDVFALGLQLKHVKTYSPDVVRQNKPELIEIMIELSEYLGDLS